MTQFRIMVQSMVLVLTIRACYTVRGIESKRIGKLEEKL